jgi:hypothetical protein
MPIQHRNTRRTGWVFLIGMIFCAPLFALHLSSTVRKPMSGSAGRSDRVFGVLWAASTEARIPAAWVSVDLLDGVTSSDRD